MELFDIYRFVHISAAIVWVGGGILGAVFTRRAVSAAPAHRLGIARDMEFASTRVFMPASIVTLAFGILMVIDAEAYGFSQAWIILGLSGIGLSAILGAGFLGPQSQKLVAELESSDPGATSRLKRIERVAFVDLVVLLAVVWAMVAKPGLG